MSSIIMRILSSTVGALCGKARDSAASKLGERGDLADEKLRGIIVQDLADIKSKLDALSVKELDASFSFLKEGVVLLNTVLGEQKQDEKTNEASLNAAASAGNETASGILNATLSLPSVFQALHLSSEKRFISAQGRFKESRGTATHAFNNNSLSIKDRIMACKLRVAATILESGLENPEAAIDASLIALDELHSLAAITEIFKVFFSKGLRSRFGKSERLENIMSVLHINRVLYDFGCKYGCKHPNPFNWPQIELKDRAFHPFVNAHEILKHASFDENFNQRLNDVIFDPMLQYRRFAVNSRGDIIFLDDAKIKIIDRTGGKKEADFPLAEDREFVYETRVGALAVDSKDDVYIVRWRESQVKKGSNENENEFVLNVFDGSYNNKHVSVLDFLFLECAEANNFSEVNIAVDKQENLIVLPNWNKELYVCDNTGKLKSKFKRHGNIFSSLSISKGNDVIISAFGETGAILYSTEGRVKSAIKLPESHLVLQVAFHHGICKTIVLSFAVSGASTFLHSYSEKGELENSVFFHKEDCHELLAPRILKSPAHLWKSLDMDSHVSGLLAVKTGNTVTIL